MFHTSVFLSVWIILLTSNLVFSNTWMKCYGNECDCEGIAYSDYDPSTPPSEVDHRTLQMKNVDKTKCSCRYEGHGYEMDCYEDEKSKAVCWEMTQYKSTGQPISKFCDSQDRSKPLELGCKPVPDLGPEAEICYCAEPLCNTKYKNQLPKNE